MIRIAFNIFFCVFLSLVSAQESQAFTRVGNGGAGWVCRHIETNEPLWLELVDLFEARMEYALEIPDMTVKDEWEILEGKLEYIREHLPKLSSHLSVDIDYLRTAIRILPNGASLAEIDDGYIRVRPASSTCVNGKISYVQLANFTYDDRLLIDGDLWRNKVFSIRDKGALLVHEIVYKSLRDKDGDRTSSRARSIVGFLFSSLPPETKRVLIDNELAHRETRR